MIYPFPTYIRDIEEYVELHRDPKTGIAWVEDGRSGNGHSAHPNIDATGSPEGMKILGHWDRADVTVRCHGCIYNISKAKVSDRLDAIANKYCLCPGTHADKEVMEERYDLSTSDK